MEKINNNHNWFPGNNGKGEYCLNCGIGISDEDFERYYALLNKHTRGEILDPKDLEDLRHASACSPW